MSAYIVIPAYNEKECISDVVREWHGVVQKLGEDSRLVVLNDGSKDATLETLQSLAETYSQLVVIDKPNSGHGSSCLEGYRYAAKQSAEWIFQTDSDGQTKPEEFWMLWEKRTEFPFLFGCRKSRGDGIGRWVISRVLRAVIFLIFRVYVKDANVPFRLMRADRLTPYLDCIPKDFFLANALLSVLIEKGDGIKWVCITFRDRQGGIASVNYRRFFSVGCRVTKDFWRYKRERA